MPPPLPRKPNAALVVSFLVASLICLIVSDYIVAGLFGNYAFQQETGSKRLADLTLFAAVVCWVGPLLGLVVPVTNNLSLRWAAVGSAVAVLLGLFMSQYSPIETSEQVTEAEPWTFPRRMLVPWYFLLPALLGGLFGAGITFLTRR